jgi:CheY-like chemotaxis protein
MKLFEGLLFEDNVGDALFVGQALAECPPRSTHTSPAMASRRFKSWVDPILSRISSLIILHLNMPKMWDYAVLYPPTRQKTPVVVFTASENQADSDRAISLGAKDVVHK